MQALFQQIWNYEFYLFPVIAAVLVFEASSILRRYFRWAYTPIYFLFFPLGHADKLYAQYVNEDDFYQVGRYMSPKEKSQLRLKIIMTSLASMIFSVVVNPLVAGIFSAFTLNAIQFQQFVYTLLLLKIILLSISIKNLEM